MSRSIGERFNHWCERWYSHDAAIIRCSPVTCARPILSIKFVKGRIALKSRLNAAPSEAEALSRPKYKSVSGVIWKLSIFSLFSLLNERSILGPRRAVQAADWTGIEPEEVADGHQWWTNISSEYPSTFLMFVCSLCGIEFSSNRDVDNYCSDDNGPDSRYSWKTWPW